MPAVPYRLSIQGLADSEALGLLAHTGDLGQDPHGRALIKLAGTQPTPNPSGRKRHSLTSRSHQGRGRLRTVLYFTTLRLLIRNEAIQYHYRRLTTRATRPLSKNLS